MTPRFALKTAGKLVLIYIGMVFACTAWGQGYVRLLLPLYQWEIHWLAPEYYSVILTIGEQHGEHVIALDVTTAGYVRAGNRFLPPGVSMSCSTLLGHILQHVIVMMSLLLAWPVRRWYDYAGRVITGIPFLFAVEWLDVPLVLLGSLDDLVLSQLVPEAESGSLSVYWLDFLNGGGRLALSITAAIVTLATYHIIITRFRAMAIRLPAIILPARE